MIKRSIFAAVAAPLLVSSAIAQAPPAYDLLIDNGTIYDGMGGAAAGRDYLYDGEKDGNAVDGQADKIPHPERSEGPTSTILDSSSRSLPRFAHSG